MRRKQAGVLGCAFAWKYGTWRAAVHGVAKSWAWLGDGTTAAWFCSTCRAVIINPNCPLAPLRSLGKETKTSCLRDWPDFLTSYIEKIMQECWKIDTVRVWIPLYFIVRNLDFFLEDDRQEGKQDNRWRRLLKGAVNRIDWEDDETQVGRII